MSTSATAVQSQLFPTVVGSALKPRSEIRRGLAAPANFQGMIGNGPKIQTVFSLLERIAPHFSTVLVTGETGTGKELVARALHDLSPARRGHMVVLNCSAVVETLFESELFGHVRGAFTGASTDKVGLVEFANGGTLFLDEIGDMPLVTQAKLLRVLQSREVQRLGSLTAKKVDFRLVAATNKELRKAVADRLFREDLFYRLSMVEVQLPPLRERPEDLASLTSHFVREWSTRFGKSVESTSTDVQKALAHHSWPGNVRELQNAVGHACMMAVGEELELGDLPAYLTAGGDHEAERVALPSVLSAAASDAFDELEIRLVRQALEDAGGNQIRAARLLRTTRDRLRYRMKKYGLEFSGKPHQAAACA